MSLNESGPTGHGAQQGLPFERSESRTSLFGGLPICRRGMRFLDALADLCWERTGGPSSGGPLELETIAKKMRCSPKTAQRAKDDAVIDVDGKSVPLVSVGEVSGLAHTWSINLSVIVDASNWVPTAHIEMTGVPSQSDRGSRDILSGVPSQNDRGSRGDPQHASNHANNAHAGNELLKSKTGGWDGGLSPSELSNLASLKRRFDEATRKKSRTGEAWVLEANQEWLGFVAAAWQAIKSTSAARQPGKERPNDPCRVFTSLVKKKAWRTKGEGGLPEAALDAAREMIRRANGGIKRVAPHPDLAKPAEPQPVGAAAAEYLAGRANR